MNGATPGTTQSQIAARAKWMVVAAFSLHALQTSFFFSRIPEIQKNLGLGAWKYSIALGVFATGLILSSPFTARVMHGLGIKRVFLLFFMAIAMLNVAVGYAGNLLALTLVFSVLGICQNYANLAINIEADRVEARHGIRIMNFCHAMWAAVFLGGAALSTLVINMGVSVPTQLWAGLVITALVLIAFAVSYENAPERPGTRARRSWAMPTKLTLTVFCYFIYGIVIEMTLRFWGVIFIRDTFSLSDAAASIGLPAFFAMAALGRFIGDPLIARFGAVAVVRRLVAITGVGILLVVFAPTAIVAIGGLLLCGLGVSVSYPMAFSLTARKAGADSADRIAALNMVQQITIAFLPFVFGAIAEEFGLRLSLGLLVVLPILAMFFTAQFRDY